MAKLKPDNGIEFMEKTLTDRVVPDLKGLFAPLREPAGVAVSIMSWLSTPGSAVTQQSDVDPRKALDLTVTKEGKISLKMGELTEAQEVHREDLENIVTSFNSQSELMSNAMGYLAEQNNVPVEQALEKFLQDNFGISEEPNPSFDSIGSGVSGSAKSADQPFQAAINKGVDPLYLKVGPNGQDVVDGTLDQVYKVFPVKKGAEEFFGRVARVESKYGTDPNTFTIEDDGGGFGIFQLDRNSGFPETKNVESHPNLKEAHANIKKEFGIDWMKVKYEDMDRPLISALAARLFVLNIPDPIPTTLKEQAKYWKKHYNTELGKGTEQHFIDSAKDIGPVSTNDLTWNGTAFV